jgi:hypothetical protein
MGSRIKGKGHHLKTGRGARMKTPPGNVLKRPKIYKRAAAKDLLVYKRAKIHKNFMVFWRLFSLEVADN